MALHDTAGSECCSFPAWDKPGSLTDSRCVYSRSYHQQELIRRNFEVQACGIIRNCSMPRSQFMSCPDALRYLSVSKVRIQKPSSHRTYMIVLPIDVRRLNLFQDQGTEYEREGRLDRISPRGYDLRMDTFSAARDRKTMKYSIQVPMQSHHPIRHLSVKYRAPNFLKSQWEM